MSADLTSNRIAVIDTDSGFVRVLTKRLEGAGWQYRVLASTPRVEELTPMRLNALVLDIELLGTDGRDFLGCIHSTLPSVGVIVCTGRSSVAQRVLGLRAGADDWVTKPCHPEEVIVRAEVAIRRRRRHAVSLHKESVSAGELEIRANLFQAFVNGERLDLTRREFEVLQLLADSGGHVLERDQIYERVWGYTMARGDRSVDVFVRKVRLKLEKASPGWDYIHTHFGIGYRFDAQSKASAPAPPVGESPVAESPQPGVSAPPATQVPLAQ